MDKWNMIKDYIPFTFFKKQKLISGNPVNDIPALYDIYGVKNSDELIAVYSQSSYARFRKSEKLEIDKINLIGWVKLVNFEAMKLNVGPFDSRNKEGLLAELKNIFKNNTDTVALTRSALAKYGIKFIIQSHPDHCAVDGVSFWSNGNPAIGMSIRHKRIDNFAFIVLHELGHIFLHLVNNNKAEFIDLEKEANDTDYVNSKEENEANSFSSNSMLDSDSWENFIANNTIHNKRKVLEFAEKTGIHPGIIYGRYSKETGNYKIKSSIDKTLN
ncbi:MAG: ImmA/IrrE family metallo-endopeptidase, partial [Daejeonella sp.]